MWQQEDTEIAHAESVHDEARGMRGVRFVIDIGNIDPFDAAAMWWDQQGCARELFPGTGCEMQSGSFHEPRFVVRMSVPLPGVGHFTQTLRFSAERASPEVFVIVVDAFEENVLWTRGLGTYRFSPGSGGTTLIEVTSLYAPKVPIIVLNQASLAAARAHQRRYLSGRRPTDEERAQFLSAIGAGPQADA
ncbi:hypothetical protein WME95_29130 [Sorangium sp. So ce327]|uniref:hypothetical protein n=1 Tax=unclassified Sorangium TaxID=2621164 RepID=UPI003F635CA5